VSFAEDDFYKNGNEGSNKEDIKLEIIDVKKV
jgi:hypothetical protein